MEIESSLLKRITCVAEAWEISVEQLVHQLLLSGLRGHNQTDEEWLRGITSETLGTGIFIIPDVENNKLGILKKVYVRNITYSDCVRRGREVIAFKWVPSIIASYEDLQKAACQM